MPAELLPCPFCGGKASPASELDNFFIVAHDSWQCPMAAASKMVFQVINLSESTEWNERADAKESDLQTGAQQLQAKIAAVVSDMEVDSKKVCGIEVEYYLNRLRQLSAVQ